VPEQSRPRDARYILAVTAPYTHYVRIPEAVYVGLTPLKHDPKFGATRVPAGRQMQRLMCIADKMNEEAQSFQTYRGATNGRLGCLRCLSDYTILVDNLAEHPQRTKRC
jgi:hypothetical protein